MAEALALLQLLYQFKGFCFILDPSLFMKMVLELNYYGGFPRLAHPRSSGALWMFVLPHFGQLLGLPVP